MIGQNGIKSNQDGNKKDSKLAKKVLIMIVVIVVIVTGINLCGSVYEACMLKAEDGEYSSEENIAPGGLIFTTIRSEEAFENSDSSLPDWAIGKETDSYAVNATLYPYADIEYDYDREGYYITVHPYYAADKKFKEEVYSITRVDNSTNMIMNWWNDVSYPLMTKSEVYLNLDRAKTSFKEGKYEDFGMANYGLEELIDENVHYNDQVQYMRFDCEIMNINSDIGVMGIEYYDAKESKRYQEIIETSLIGEYSWLFDLEVGDEISLFTVYGGKFIYKDDTTVYPLLIAVGCIPADDELLTYVDNTEIEDEVHEDIEEAINIYGKYQMITSHATAQAEVSVSSDTGENYIYLGVYNNNQHYSNEMRGALEHVEGNTYRVSVFEIVFTNNGMKIKVVDDVANDYYSAFEGDYTMISQIDWSQVG